MGNLVGPKEDGCVYGIKGTQGERKENSQR